MEVIGLIIYDSNNLKQIESIFIKGWSILLIGATECFVLSYLYGLKNLRKDIVVMMGPVIGNKYLFYFWASLWAVISPGLCLALCIIQLTKQEKIVVGDYAFPDWTHVIGELLSASMYAGIVIWAIYAIIDALFINKKPFLSLFKPDFENYVPDLPENQRLVRISRGLEALSEKDVQFSNKVNFESYLFKRFF